MAVGENATVAVKPFEYAVGIPDFNRRQLQSQIGQEVSLHTLHHMEGNPAHGKLTPRLIGFLRAEEREFFEMFCSVDGVGVKKTLKAMVRPVRDVAEAIVFFASDRSRMITGQRLLVNAGELM